MLHRRISQQLRWLWLYGSVSYAESLRFLARARSRYIDVYLLPHCALVRQVSILGHAILGLIDPFGSVSGQAQPSRHATLDGIP